MIHEDQMTMLNLLYYVQYDKKLKYSFIVFSLKTFRLVAIDPFSHSAMETRCSKKQVNVTIKYFSINLGFQ